jgi:hypothetical protein
MGVKTANESLDSLSRKVQETNAAYQKNMDDIGGLIKGGIAAFGGFAAVTAILDGVKSVMESTQGSAGKLDEVMAGLSNSTQEFKQMVATGNMDNFAENMIKAAVGGERFAAAMKLITQQKLGQSLNEAEAAPELTNLLDMAKDNKNSIDTRQAALDKYKMGKEDLAKQNQKIANDEVTAREADLASLGISAAMTKKYYENINSDIETVKKSEEDLKHLEELRDKEKFAGRGGDYNKYLEAKKAADDYYNSLDEKERYYVSVLQNDNKLNKQTAQDYIDALKRQANAQNDINSVKLETQKLQNGINTKEESTTKELKKQSDSSDNLLDNLREMAGIEAKYRAPSAKENDLGFSKDKQDKETDISGSYDSQAPSKVFFSNPKDIPKTTGDIKNLKNEIKDLKPALLAVDNIFKSFASSVKDGSSSFKEFGRAVASSARQAISALLSESVALAIEKAMKTAKNPLIGVALGAIAGGAVATLFNTLVPAFEDGTNYAPGGLSLVGERGPELVNLNRGSQVFTNAQTMGMMNGGELTTRVNGSDLEFVLKNHSRLKNSY